MRLDRGQPSRGSGIPLRELRGDARQLEDAEFDDRHGRAFLILSAADLARPLGATSTEVRLSSDGPGRDSTVGLSLLVYPVRRNGRSAGHLITIGRSDDNDVVVPDVSISRFHAFVKEGANGEWLMHDAGSTNGTTVNGHSAPQQGQGSPVQLKSGDDVRLGQVDLTFLEADALRSFALRLVR